MTAYSNSRRKFLMLAMGAGGVAALGMAAGLNRRNAVAAPLAAELKTVTRTSWALGSDVALTVLHADEEVATRAINAAFAELNVIEDVMSVYRPNSQISRLNATGKLNQPHAHFMTVMQASQDMARTSNGAFDASVQPLWDLYSEAKNKKTLPTKAAIDAARAKVNFRAISVSPGSIEFKTPGMKITFNGIAQGYAADCVLTVLKSHGIEHALIDTGEFTSEGRKADGEAFKVGIQHPRNSDAFVGVCAMDGRALATSGDYNTYFSDDFVYNHIFDPSTGRSPLELSSVSIVAPTGILADALTKPVFILGAEKGLALIESMPRCDALLITKDGKTIKTKGFPLA